MKSISDGTGVCFDIFANQADAFIENYEHLKTTHDSRRVDFQVSRCKTLPKLEGGSSGGGSYGNSGGGGSYGNGGGGYNGGGGGSYGNGSKGHSRGGDRGGDGGRGGYNNNRGNDRGNERDHGSSRGNGGGGGGNGGGWGGGGSGWNKENTLPQTFDPRKQKYDSSAYESPFGGSTSYSTQSVTPSYEQKTYSNSKNNEKVSNSNSTLYFTNLSYSTSEHDLMTFLKSQNFNPKRAKLLYDQEGRSKGTGFVQMLSDFDAQSVL